MTDSDPTPPSSRPRTHWRPWHTLTLIALTAILVGMAIRHPLGIYWSWIVVMVTLVLFIAVAGHGIQGMWRGALIDERNKISLSRLQMLTWTVVVLSGSAPSASRARFSTR